MAGEREDRK